MVNLKFELNFLKDIDFVGSYTPLEYGRFNHFLMANVLRMSDDFNKISWMDDAPEKRLFGMNKDDWITKI